MHIYIVGYNRWIIHTCNWTELVFQLYFYKQQCMLLDKKYLNKQVFHPTKQTGRQLICVKFSMHHLFCQLDFLTVQIQ